MSGATIRMQTCGEDDDGSKVRRGYLAPWGIRETEMTLRRLSERNGSRGIQTSERPGVGGTVSQGTFWGLISNQLGKAGRRGVCL